MAPRPARRVALVGAALACAVLLGAACSDDTGTDRALTTTTARGTTGPSTTAASTTVADPAGPGATTGTTGAEPADGQRPRTEGTEAAGVAEGAGARVVGRLSPDGGVPLSDGDFADPFVLDTGLIPVGYASNTLAANVPVSRAGLRGEIQLGDALPEVGSWSREGLVWAPGVLEADRGRYVLYYTSLDTASGRQCIGAAVAPDALGPYVDESDEPFVCQRVLGGSIDASPATIDGTSYLLWKSDGNCCGLPTSIWSQQLGADGTSLVGQPTPLLVNDLAWEGPLVEGPSMIEVDGKIHLFYSANLWDTDRYAIGHAVCASPTGPCEKDPKPFLTSTDDYSGPGGQEFYTDRAGRLWMTFHGWLPGEIGYAGGGSRRLFVEEVTFDRQGNPQLALGN